MPSTVSQPYGYSRAHLVLLAALATAGMAANCFQVPVMPQVAFVFGAVFPLLALHFLGLGSGVAVAALVALTAQFPAGLPQGMVIPVLEALLVGLAISKPRIGMIQADTLFWLFLGMPLTYLVYRHIQQVPDSTSLCLALRQGVNSITSAILARLIITGYHLRRGGTLMPLRDVVFNMLALFIVCPAFLLVAVSFPEEAVVSARQLPGASLEAAAQGRLALEEGPGRTFRDRFLMLLLIEAGSAALAQAMSLRFIPLIKQLAFALDGESGTPEGDARRPPGPAAWFEEAYHLLKHCESMAEIRRSLYLQINELNTSLEEQIAERTEDLVESEGKYRLLFDNAGDAIFVSDGQGRLLAANPSACEHLGYSQPELLGLNWDRIDLSGCRAWEAESDRHSVQGHLLYETKQLRRDGTPVPTEVSARMVTWAGAPAVLSICRDLTERKQSEEELRQALEAAETAYANMQRLLRTVSHEFRTPLGLLTCCVDILDRYWGKLTTKERRLQHECIRNAAGQLTTLVSSVISFNQEQAHHGPEPVDVEELCRDISADVASVWGGAHRFEVNIEEGCGSGHLDRSLFRRVLENLLTNSFRFTPPGGEVALQVSRVSQRLRIKVADTGIGIAEEDQQLIFDAFYRGRNVEGRRGLGLGLSIVQEALAGMGGTIDLSSRLDAGCTMAVEIPLN